ncbi:MAG: hypothetical protein HQK72_07165 [Desulfamplus sp.]|nr:hypothetical protein [Desulfamplus sp.]
MKLRIIISVLAILAVLSASAGGGLYYYSLKKTAFQHAESHANKRLELFNKQLVSSLSEHVKPVKAFSGLEELEHFLSNIDKVKLNGINALTTDNRIKLDNPAFISSYEKINAILDNFAYSLNLEVCYLMDKNGTTIASSNRGEPDSFVGKNFAFRPYFLEALEDRPSTYFALGTTSMKRGVYYSHPVYNSQSHEIIGVAVMKASVELIESKLFAGSEGILLVVDPNGIIFISNKQEIKLMLMWELGQDEIEKIKLTRQFGDIELLWTGFTPLSEGYMFDKNMEKYLYSQMPLDGYKGWKIVHLRNVKEISKEVADPFIKIIGQVIIIVSIFIAISVFILYKKALQEIFKRKQVEERTQELKQVQDQLRKLSGNIMATHENERRAVARELHDHLGQILTALKMDGVWLEKYLEPIDSNAAQRANRICSLIDDTIADVRAMAFRLRPGLLDDLGLVDALESLVRDFEKRSDVWFLFRHTEIPEIDDAVSTSLYRIAQEALTNALKHSKATEISVDLSATPVTISAHELNYKADSKCHLTLTVEDNGCGFSSVGDKEYHGLGLTGMKERATLAGGTLEIFSAPYKGTKIVCNLIS